MLDVLYYPVSAVMWVWHTLFALVLGPSSGLAWALSVVFLVLTLRALMIRPFLAQLRSAQALRALSPQLAELRRRHGDDRRRLADETRKLQQDHGVSPLGALAPALIQIPVFLALLHVLRYFNRPGLTFEQNAAIPNYVFGPAQVRSFLEARLFGAPLSAWIHMPQNLLDSFGGHVGRLDVVVVAAPLMVLAAVATHLTARAALRRQADVAPVAAAGPAMAVMRATPWIYPLGVLLGGLFAAFPVAILLYWLTNNLWTLVQQHLVFRRFVVPEPPRPAEAVAVPAEPAPARRPGAKPVAARTAAGHRPTSAAARTGGRAAAGRRSARRR